MRIFRALDFVDSFAVITDRYCVVIDTLVSPETVAQVMAALQAELAGPPSRDLLVVNTHADWDHTWGNAFFDGPTAQFLAPIVGHTASARRIDLDEAKRFLADSQSRHPGWYDGVDFRLPTIEFEDSLTIRGGDLSLQLIPTPGHTPDHVCVWIPELRLLIAGDAAELPLPYVDDYRTLPALRASLQSMLELRPEMVLYCHGAGMYSPDLIEHNLWYFDDLETRTRVALGANPDADPIELSADVLRWPLEEVMPGDLRVDELFSVDFYRDSHDRAIRAMASWVMENPVSNPPAQDRPSSYRA